VTAGLAGGGVISGLAGGGVTAGLAGGGVTTGLATVAVFVVAVWAAAAVSGEA
jgi:hypothetical protein